MHQNVPGVMQKINEIIATHNINIRGTWLQTRGEIGYVVIDLANIADEELLLSQFRGITGTIKTNILNS